MTSPFIFVKFYFNNTKVYIGYRIVESLHNSYCTLRVFSAVETIDLVSLTISF